MCFLCCYVVVGKEDSIELLGYMILFESYKRFGIRKEVEVVKRKRDIGINKYEKKIVV